MQGRLSKTPSWVFGGWLCLCINVWGSYSSIVQQLQQYYPSNVNGSRVFCQGELQQQKVIDNNNGSYYTYLVPGILKIGVRLAVYRQRGGDVIAALLAYKIARTCRLDYSSRKYYKTTP